MDLDVAVVGKWRYAEPLEEMFARGFEQIGARTYRWKWVEAEGYESAYLDGVVPQDGPADLALCVKALSPNPDIAAVRALYFSDLTARFPDQWRLFSRFVGREDHDIGYKAAFLPHDEERVVNRKTVFHIPVGYDPGYHAPVGWHSGEYPAFVGTWTPGREWIRSYPEIKICGNGWGRGIQDIYGLDRAILYRGCMFALNWHNPGETVNMRQFEVLAMGVPLVTDREWELSDGVDYVGAVDEAVEAYEYYRARPDELKRLAKSGQEIVKPHTYANRCLAILKDLGMA